MENSPQGTSKNVHPDIIGKAYPYSDGLTEFLMPGAAHRDSPVKYKNYRLVFGEPLSVSRAKAIQFGLGRHTLSKDLQEFLTPDVEIAQFSCLQDLRNKGVLVHTIPLLNQAYHALKANSDNSDIVVAVPGMHEGSLQLDATIFKVMQSFGPGVRADLERLYLNSGDLSHPELKNKIGSIATFFYRLNKHLFGHVPENLGLDYVKSKTKEVSEEQIPTGRLSPGERKIKLDCVKGVMEQAFGCKIHFYVRGASNKDLININFGKRQITINEDILRLKIPEIIAFVEFAMNFGRYAGSFQTKSADQRFSGALLKSAVDLSANPRQLKTLYTVVVNLQKMGWNVSPLKAYLNRVKRLAGDLKPGKFLEELNKAPGSMLHTASKLNLWFSKFSETVLNNKHADRLIYRGDLDLGVSKLFELGSNYAIKTFKTNFIRENAGAVFLLSFLEEASYEDALGVMMHSFREQEEEFSINRSIDALLRKRQDPISADPEASSGEMRKNYKRFEAGIEVLQAFLGNSQEVKKLLDGMLSFEKVLLLTELERRRTQVNKGLEHDLIKWMVLNNVRSYETIIESGAFSSDLVEYLGTLFEPIASQRAYIIGVNYALEKLRNKILPEWVLGAVPALNSAEHASVLAFLGHNKLDLLRSLNNFENRLLYNESRLYVEMLLACEPSLDYSPREILTYYALKLVRNSAKIVFGSEPDEIKFSRKTFDTAARYLTLRQIDEGTQLIAGALDTAVGKGAKYSSKLAAYISLYAVNEKMNCYSENCLKAVLINEFISSQPTGYFTPGQFIDFVKSYPREMVRNLIGKVYRTPEQVLVLCYKVKGTAYEALLGDMIDPARIYAAIKDYNTDQLRDFLRGFNQSFQAQITGSFGSNTKRAVTEREKYERHIQNYPLELDCLSTNETLPNYLAVLGLPRRHTPEQLKQSYFLLSRIYHPDSFMQEGEEQVELAKENQKAIAEAFEVLNDDAKRNAYYRKIPNNAQYYPERSWIHSR